MFRRHPILSVLAVGYLALVAWLTLTPQSGRPEAGLLWEVLDIIQSVPGTDWVTFSGLEFAANIAMFMPFGLFLVLLFGRRWWWLAIGCGVLLTLGIEYAQQFIPSRVPDVRDLVSNSIGATLGALLAVLITTPKARRLRREERARQLRSREAAPVSPGLG